MKYSLFTLFLVFICFSAYGKILRVNFNGSTLSGVDFKLFEDACTYAANGDTIQIYGDVQTQSNSGDFVIKKRLVIQGFGYNFDINSNLQATSLDAPSRIFGNWSITFGPGSENSIIEGLVIISEANFEAIVKIATSNITIRRSAINVLIDNSARQISGLRIESCVVNSLSEFTAQGYPTINTKIVNCILSPNSIQFHKAESTGLIVNCVEMPRGHYYYLGSIGLNSSSFLVKNSIFDYPYPLPNAPNTIWENCFFRSPQPGQLPKGSNNRWGQSYTNLFDMLGGTSMRPGQYLWEDACQGCALFRSTVFDENFYRLKENSPARKAGFDSKGDSTDCGIFGGDPAFRYQLGGVPAIPAIYKLSSTSTEATANPYNVTVSMRSNSSANISRVEYFIDSDPGIGRGTALPITPGMELKDLVIPVNPERLLPCQHTLYVRAKDADGHWSFTYSYTFTNKAVSPTFSPGDYMVQLDGANDYLNLGTWFNLPKFTISFWVKPDRQQTRGAAIAALQNDLYLYANPDVQNNYVLSHLLQFDLAPDKWNYITITVDAATQQRKVYLFGQLIDSNTWAYFPTNGFNLRFGNGGFFPGSYFRGQLDEIKLWNYNLTDDEIYRSMHSVLTGAEAGLAGYWDFNGGCTTEAFDKSPNQRNGTLVNGVVKLPSTVPNVGQQIIPNKGGNTNVVTVKIYDNLFQQGAKARMTRIGFADILADTTIISNDGTVASCSFNLTGKDTGLYNIIVANPDTNVKVYNNSFTVEEFDSTGKISIQILGRNVYRKNTIHKLLIVYQNTGNIDVKAPAFTLKSFEGNYVAYSKEDLIYKWQVLPVLLGNRMSVDYSGFTNSEPVLSPGTIYSKEIFTLDSSPDLGKETEPCDLLNQFILEGVYPNRPDFDGSGGGASLPVPPDNNGHNYIDGCSNPQFMVGYINGELLGHSSNDINWNDIFLPACVEHDKCYQTCYKKPPNGPIDYRPKNICDAEMHRIMEEICNNYSGNKNDCKIAALAYFWGVQLAGKGAFDTNQSYCTGQVGVTNPPPGTGNTYFAPDCKKCLPGQICFSKTPISSYDPNEKIGSSKFQKGSSNLSYLINFENIASATAAAQQVTVIDTLDKSKYDLNTFRFGPFGFSDATFASTYPLQKSFTQNIDLRPKTNLILNVAGRLDTASGIVYWKITSLDPATMMLTEDPYLGFLPPNKNSPEGEGFVSFNVMPRENLATGTPIENKASIIFDYNQPIITNLYTNIIDKTPPQSQVLALNPVQADSNFVVTWSGRDDISGIGSYDIYVSVNDSTFVLWLSGTSDTSAVYPGHPDHTYRFYSIATDRAKNAEIKSLVEATTTVPKGDPLGIPNDPDPKDLFAVYPNPANSEVNVKGQNISSIRIMDTAGRQLYISKNKNVSSAVIDISKFSKGIYLIEVQLSDGQRQVKKLIKI
ncbi:MAG: DUF7619 domain-containing protein [Adhaeribacter sp.]